MILKDTMQKKFEIHMGLKRAGERTIQNIKLFMFIEISKLKKTLGKKLAEHQAVS